MGDLPGLRVAVKKAQYSVLQNVVSPTGVSLKISRLVVVVRPCRAEHRFISMFQDLIQSIKTGTFKLYV